MTEKVMMKGNEAIGEAAILAGCLTYFGYPITPQSELPAYLARRLLKIDGAVFLQAESEIADARKLCQYMVVNDDLEQAIGEVIRIIQKSIGEKQKC